MDWRNIDGHLRKYGPIFQFIFVFLLIMGGLFKPDHINITWQIISLIIMLLVIPYIPLIKKVRYGDWEAELESLLTHAERTIEEPDMTKSASENGEGVDGADGIKEEREVSEQEEEVSRLRRVANAESRISQFKNQTEYYLTQDPIVALSNLRMELDRTLEALADQHDIDYHEELGMPLNSLIKHNILPSEEVDDLNQIYDIANKAIHGEEVNRETAQRILNLGERVLKRLYVQIEADISTDPDEPPVEVESEES